MARFGAELTQQLTTKIASVEHQSELPVCEIEFWIPPKVYHSIGTIVSSLIHVLFEQETNFLIRCSSGRVDHVELVIFDFPARRDDQFLKGWIHGKSAWRVLSDITSKLSERPIKSADQKTERGKV